MLAGAEDTTFDVDNKSQLVVEFPCLDSQAIFSFQFD
jgi:hypothetical protein